MMSGIFSFGHFRLDVRERVLTKDGAPVGLGSRAFDLLLALLERAGETVYREALFELVWPDVVVSKVNLRVHVAAIRKALEDGRDGNRFIVNVPGRGYRFVAPVSRFQATALAAEPDRAVCLVDCAGIYDNARVAMAVASALGCDVVKPHHALAFVLAYLRDKEMLVVFENCDRVFAAVSQFTERVLTEAPLAHVLVANQGANVRALLVAQSG